MRVQVELNHGYIRVVGGAHHGGCSLHKMLSRWPGWRRVGKCEEGSVFTAPLYSHTSMECLKLWDVAEVACAEADKWRIKRTANAVGWAKEALKRKPDTWTLLGRQLHPHQSQAMHAAAMMEYQCLIADDMGLGKTTTAIACWAESEAKRLLIVCPSSVKRNWEREIRECLGEDVPVFLLDGSPTKRSVVMAEMAHIMSGVAIINYDLLPHLKDRAVEILEKWSADNMVVLDESHYIKSREAKRTKWCLEHLRGAKQRICLTGTPVRNMIDDLYTQAEFVRPGFWTSYHDFCRRYLIQVRVNMGGRTFLDTKGTKNTAELNQLVNTFQIRRSKEEAFDLPPKVRTIVDLELDSATKRVYKAIRELAVIDLAGLDDETPMFQPKAASAVEGALRCEQVSQGFIGGLPESYVEKVMPLIVGHAERIPGRDGELIFPKSEKIRWIQETIESVLSQGGAPVVFSKFNGPLFWLVEKLEGFAVLHGGLSTDQRDKVIEDFQSGELRGLLCQVKIAEGFNLTRSHDVIFYGRDWSPAINAQAEDRCHRIGTTGTVNIQIPIMSGTIEQHIHKRLAAKADDADGAIKNLTVGELREIL